MRYRVPDDVAWVAGAEILDADPHLYVMVVPDGTPVVLDAMGSLIWQAAGSGLDAVAEVTTATGEMAETIRASVEGFLSDLVAHGLLETDT